LTTTTRALDEAAQRISRYLLMQTTINAVFGLVIGMGLLLIGLPYALLWGALAGALRFIPYAGPWAAGALITVFSLAVFPGWPPPSVGLFVVSELLSALVMEPSCMHQSAGVSQVALLVMVGF
jgi:predicted PurR-regulated permease PerM